MENYNQFYDPLHAHCAHFSSDLTFDGRFLLRRLAIFPHPVRTW